MVGKLARQTEAEDSAKELAVKQATLLQQRARLLQVRNAGLPTTSIFTRIAGHVRCCRSCCLG
jgi:hypothetical protein